MTHMNEISSKNIENLEAAELVELLRCLLSNEVLRHSIDPQKISVSGNLYAPDGGEDGYIRWDDSSIKTKWLPHNEILIQCKAKDLQPGECKKEILVKDAVPKKLKPKVESIVNNNGCYILLTIKQCNPQMKNDRITAFYEAILEAGHKNYGQSNIRIYDADSIRDWSNQYIAAVTKVQSFCGITRPAPFRTWNEWEKQHLTPHRFEYQSSDYILQKRERLYSLFKNKNIIRVLGQSGLGKTRFVLEAFRAIDDRSDVVSQQNQLVYYDIGLFGKEPLFQ